MEETFYFICVHAEEEPWVSDGFATYDERRKAMREELRYAHDVYNVLYLEIDANGRPHIQSYSDCVDDDFDESDCDLDEPMDES
jgi:hypothetical protein